MSSRGRTIAVALVVSGLCGVACCQTVSSAQPADQNAPAYEVATIKPSDGQGFALTLRMYIESAFGVRSAQLIGPEWIDQKRYDIHGKPSDSVRDAMSKMTSAERGAENRRMEQTLLADRFQLKYHVETREIRQYRLVVAKGGVRLTANPDPTKASARFRDGGKTTEIMGTALTMDKLVGLLVNAPELGGYPVINNTGIAGNYDFTLKWSALIAGNSGNDATMASNDDAPDLFTAIQDELGLRLEVGKAPAKVLVIDHIELPSPN
jgi:uncharacterized protein (TIGR03435 family)